MPDGTSGATFYDIRKPAEGANPQSTSPEPSKLKGTGRALAIHWKPGVANAFPFGGDMRARDWPKFWYDHPSTLRHDPPSHHYPYTTTNDDRGHVGYDVSYSCGRDKNAYTLVRG